MNDSFQISYIIEIRVWDTIDIFFELASNNYHVDKKGMFCIKTKCILNFFVKSWFRLKINLSTQMIGTLIDRLRYRRIESTTF